MTDRLKPLTIIPDPEYRLPGYKSTRVVRSLASFRAGTGFLTFNCHNIREHVNVQRMIQLFATGKSPLLVGAGMTSEDILVQTSVSHELRHFHDCLLSFTFFEALRRKLLLIVNSVELFRHLPKEKDAYLPVGLLDWIMTDDQTRLTRIAQFEEFLGTNIKLRDIPYFSDAYLKLGKPSPSIEGLFLVCAQGAVTLRTLLTTQYRGNSDARLSAMDIYELSAIATQLLSITDRFGVRTASDIYHNNIKGTFYDRNMDVIDDLIWNDGKEFITGTDILILTSAMSLWAICAQPPEPALRLDKACPAMRFLRLKMKLMQDKLALKNELRNADYLLEYFDKVMEERPTCDRISASDSFFSKWTNEIEAQVADAGDKLPISFLLQYWKELLYMRHEFQRVAFNDLFFYLRGSYEGTKAFGLTLPPIVLNCSGYDFDRFRDHQGENVTDRVQAGQKLFLISDRMQKIHDVTQWVHLHEAVFDKIYLDSDISSSETHRSLLMQAVRAIVGSDVVRVPEIE